MNKIKDEKRRSELLKNLIKEFEEDGYEETLTDVEMYIDQYDEGLQFDILVYLLYLKIKKE